MILICTVCFIYILICQVHFIGRVWVTWNSFTERQVKQLETDTYRTDRCTLICTAREGTGTAVGDDNGAVIMQCCRDTTVWLRGFKDHCTFDGRAGEQPEVQRAESCDGGGQRPWQPGWGELLSSTSMQQTSCWGSAAGHKWLTGHWWKLSVKALSDTGTSVPVFDV